MTDQRILFVDDDPAVRLAFRRSLSPYGFYIDVADSARTALVFAELRQYALIAADYRMPEVDGLELIDQLQRMQPDAAFMLVSGECDLDLACEAVNNHQIHHVIAKPWNADDLAFLFRRSFERQVELTVQRKMHLALKEASQRMREVEKRLLELQVGSSRVDLQACKLEYSIVSPK